MSVAENKALAHRIVDEIWTKKDTSVIEDIYAGDYLMHTPQGDLHGPTGYRELFNMFAIGFPDCRLTIENLIGEGDQVAVQYTFTGTHTDEFQGIAPSRKYVTISGNAIIRIRDGKVTEEQSVWDTLGLMEAIGAVHSNPG